MAAEPQIPSAPWDGLGLPPLAGRILEYLVGHPETAPAEAAAAIGTSTASAQQALGLLESELLAVRVSGRGARWSASPPRPALGTLLARRREELSHLETHAERLHEVYISVTSQRFASDQFEILDTEERVTARYAHLLRAARHEVLHLVMPPYVAALALRDFQEIPVALRTYRALPAARVESLDGLALALTKVAYEGITGTGRESECRKGND